MVVVNRSQSVTPTEKTMASTASSQRSVKYTDGEFDEFEFGGSFGAASLLISFPLVMWYMWIDATYYDGRFP